MLNTMLDVWSTPVQFPWAGVPAMPEALHVVVRQFDSAMGSLQYKLFIPAGHVRKPLPLVVMLHGGGQNADDFALGTGMNAVAEEHGCAVLYPEQSSRANWSMC